MAPDIDQQTLREAFAPYGEISDVKIMKDPQTLVHKGYGFISFLNKVDAEAAIAQMNGQWLGTRKIRTNWATRKVQPGGMITNEPTSIVQSKYTNKLDYNEVWSRSSDTNTTVYCGGLNNITEDLIRNTFALYGQIIGVHPFPDRGYSFVRFASKEAACNAICGVHGMEVNGGIAKCSWGKENIDMTSGPSQSASSLGMGSSMYGNTRANMGNTQSASSLQAASQLGGGGNNPWGAGAGGAAQSQSQNWAPANYQWAATAGYPQAAAQYWQGYPGYQNAMLQGWGVMPTAGGAGGSNAGGNSAAAAQYAQMGQYQQNSNGKS